MRQEKFAPFGLLLAALACAPPAAVAQTATNPPAASEARFDVRGFTVTGNTLIDSVALASVLGRYKGQRTFAELEDAARTVQGLYADAGYGAVVAYLPPQPVSDGNVTINVVEGKISKVTVRGNQRLSEARVRAALPTLVEGVTPRVRRIDSELQIANENPTRQIGVLLGPGAQRGEAEATVNVEEQKVHQFNVVFDNTGNERTGDYRLGGGWMHGDITGHDDVLNLQFQTSPTKPSAIKVIGVGYRLPLPRWLTAIDLYAAYSDVDGGTTPVAVGDLSFNGSGRIAGARSIWYLPRAGKFDQRLTFGLDHRAYLNECRITGLPEGACGPGGEDVTVNPLSVEYAAQSGGPIIAGFNVSLAHNLRLGSSNNDDASFEAVRPGASADYTVLRGGASVTVPFADDWSVGGRLSLQYGDDVLVPGEQFGIGGANSVRGYDERELAGDRGYFVSVELASPRLGWSEGNKVDLRLVAFADAGQVSNRDAAPCAVSRTRCTISSVGFGARAAYGSMLQARLFVANALRDGILTRSHDWKSHFAISASF